MAAGPRPYSFIPFAFTPHLTAAAFRAISRLRLGLRLAALARPPLLAPSFDSARRVWFFRRFIVGSLCCSTKEVKFLRLVSEDRRPTWARTRDLPGAKVRVAADLSRGL